MTASALSKEDQYFLDHEITKLRKAQEDARKALNAAERKKLKELHHMHCPKCGMELREIEYRGIKVDRCFSCNGTWFDSGEVEAALKLETKTLKNIFALFKK
jgi:uncharacterized protein